MDLAVHVAIALLLTYIVLLAFAAWCLFDSDIDDDDDWPDDY
jgi:hypothetical protein